MNVSWKAAGAIWAVVLAGALCAGAVTVTTGQELVDQFKAGAPTLELQGGGGAFALPEPLYIDRNLTISGDMSVSGTLPTDVVIERGPTPPDLCYGNVVPNGDFEGGPADWTVTTNGPAVINNNNVEAYDNSNWYARFSRAAYTTYPVPDNSTDLVYGTPIDLSKFLGMPDQLDETLTWTATIPDRLSPFPITLKRSTTFPAAILSYQESITYSAAALPPFVTVWIWTPFINGTDKLEIFIGGVPPAVINTQLGPVTNINNSLVGTYGTGYMAISVGVPAALVGTAATVELRATLTGDVDTPSIILVGGVEPAAVSAADFSAPPTVAAIDLGGVGVTSTLPGGIAPAMKLTDPAFLLPLQTAAVRFGGVGRPHCGFQAQAPRQWGGAPDRIEVQYNGTTLQTLTLADFPIPADCVAVSLPAAGFTPAMGDFAFVVDIAQPPYGTDPTIFVIDELYVSYLSDWFFATSANPGLAPENFNLWPEGSFDSALGWTVSSAKPEFAALTLTDILGGGGACSASAAVFNPDTLELLGPPISLYTWARVAKSGSGSLKVDVDNGTITGTILDGADAEDANFTQKLAAPLTSIAGKPGVSFKILGSTATGTTTPAVFVLGAVELQNKVLNATDLPTTPQTFGEANVTTNADTVFDGDPAKPKSILAALPSCPTPVRFGGIHKPALKHTLMAINKNAGDTLYLMRDGAPQLALAETGTCVSQRVLLPDTWWSTPFELGFRSTIAPQTSPTQPTAYELDDLCITYVSEDLLALDPSAPACDAALPATSFNSVAGWTAMDKYTNPRTPFTRGATAGCTGNVAFFQLVPVPPAETVTLSQTGINVPWEATDLTFQLKVLTAGDPGLDSLTCTLDDGVNPPAILPIDVSAATTDYVSQILTIDPALQGKPVTLTFTAELAAKDIPASFAIDNVCLASPPSTALITVAGSGQLILSDLTLSGADTNVAVKGSAHLALSRCRVENAAVAGVLHNSSSTVDIAGCVFEGNAIGVKNDAGLMTLYQSTLFDGLAVQDNGGTSNVAACVITGDITSSVPGTARSYSCWISGSQGVTNASFPNLDILAQPLQEDTGRWKGALTTQLLSGVTEAAFTAVPLVLPADRTKDFESGGRLTNPVEVGADEVGAGAQIQDWSYSVNPTTIGLNQSVTITVQTATSDFAGMNLTLRMMPENPQFVATAQPWIDYPLDVDPVNTRQATLTTSFGGPFGTAMDGSEICTDGIPKFLLLADGTLVGGTGEPTTQPAQPLLIDTVAPLLDLATTPPTLSANDTFTTSITAPSTTPPAWPPLTAAIPRSAGNLAQRDVNYFIGQVPNTGLDLVVTGHFVERYPVDGQNRSYTVTTSGFDVATADAAAAALPGTVAVSGTLIAGPLPSLDLTWSASGIMAPGDWTFQPAAQDKVGNIAKVIDLVTGLDTTLANNMVIRWLAPPTASFTSSSANTQTANPWFYWAITPTTGLTLDQEAPCFPLVFFQIWAVDQAGDGDSLTYDWSPSFNTAAGAKTSMIGPDTPVPSVSTTTRVRDVLRINSANPAQSKQLVIAVIGADEAGTFQNFNNGQLNGTQIRAALAANSVDFVEWTNGASQGNVSVDTGLSVRLSHVAASANGLVQLRDFGGMARVPLPTVAEYLTGAYVNARVTLTALLPQQMQTPQGVPEPVVIEWRLYEEGALIAQDKGLATEVTFELPARLIALNQVGGLHTDSNGVKSRLGDEPKRQRELRYLLVAQAVATLGVADPNNPNNKIPQSIADPTPASVEFSIYPREAVEKVREEQPVRIYERR